MHCFVVLCPIEKFTKPKMKIGLTSNPFGKVEFLLVFFSDEPAIFSEAPAKSNKQLHSDGRKFQNL